MEKSSFQKSAEEALYLHLATGDSQGHMQPMGQSRRIPSPLAPFSHMAKAKRRA